MKCRNCGNEIEEELLFCPSCGEKLRESGPLDLTNIDIGYYSSNTSINKDDNHKKRSKKPYIAILCALVIGIGIGYVGRAEYGWEIGPDILNQLKIMDVIKTGTYLLFEELDNTLVKRQNDPIIFESEHHSEEIVSETESQEQAATGDRVVSETESQEQTVTNEDQESYKTETQEQTVTNEVQESYKTDESDVRTVQSLLSQAGYSSLAIDGKLGPKTKAAISDFRDKSGMPPGDFIDQELIDKLTTYIKETQNDNNEISNVEVSDTLVNDDLPRFVLGESKKEFTLSIGERVQPQASIWHGQIEIEDATIISVDEEGIITALSYGTTAVIYHGLGSLQEKYEIIVE